MWSNMCVLMPLGHWSRRLESSAEHSFVLSLSPFSSVDIGFSKGCYFFQWFYVWLINYLYIYKMRGRGPNLPAGALEWTGMRSSATKVADR
jgi:hypothetical protein